MTWSNYDNTHTEIFFAMHSRASLFRSQHKQWLYYIAPCLSHIHSSKRQLLPKEFPIRTNSVEWKVQCIAHVGIRLPVNHFLFLHSSKKHLSNVGTCVQCKNKCALFLSYSDSIDFFVRENKYHHYHHVERRSLQLSRCRQPV